jgi:acyl carrier protein
MSNDLLEILRRSIASTRNLPITDVEPRSRLEDLEVDSLAITEIIVQVELELDREFPVHLLRQLERIDTVAELADGMSAALLEDEDERRKRGRRSTSTS